MSDELSVTDVRKEYGPISALDGVSLSIDGQGIHCLAGPNGSGKSTLFRIMLGLSPPTSGAVSRPDGGIISAGFQEPSFYDSLTVAENIDVFATLSGADDQEWIDTVVDVFELQQVSHRTASELSGGFAKQLDLALALLKRPRYLLLDEPLADLDDVAVSSLLEFLSEYAGAGNTVVVSSHRIEEFGPAIDRLTVMYDGQIAQDVKRSSLAEAETIAERYREAIADAIEPN